MKFNIPFTNKSVFESLFYRFFARAYTIGTSVNAHIAIELFYLCARLLREWEC